MKRGRGNRTARGPDARQLDLTCRQIVEQRPSQRPSMLSRTSPWDWHPVRPGAVVRAVRAGLHRETPFIAHSSWTSREGKWEGSLRPERGEVEQTEQINTNELLPVRAPDAGTEALPELHPPGQQSSQCSPCSAGVQGSGLPGIAEDRHLRALQSADREHTRPHPVCQGGAPPGPEPLGAEPAEQRPSGLSPLQQRSKRSVPRLNSTNAGVRTRPRAGFQPE